MSYAIEVENLSRHFGSFKAVDNISFTVNTGEIFGFLGANGAGKSTTIRMLCGLLEPSGGKATVGGYNIATNPEQVKKHIGYMSQKFSLYEDLTVSENIDFFGGTYGLSRSQLKERMPWLEEIANIQNIKDTMTRDLPGGWKQRLALGCAVLHKPDIVFLDEPTGGVDPISRRNFWELINQLSESGVTIFVTTHYLDEAEYCNNIMLINAGKIVASGSPQHLKKEHIANPMLEMECSSLPRALELLENQPWVINISIFGTLLHVNVSDDVATASSKIKQLLSDNDITISHMEEVAPSLEDVFIKVIETPKEGTP